MKKQQQQLSKVMKYSVGVDASSEDVKLCCSTIDEKQYVKIKSSTKFNNTLSGFENAEQWIQRHHRDKQTPLVITIEATGTYYENFALYFHNKGYHVSVVLASHARQYMKSSGIKTKNDKIDAWGLSKMGAERYYESWQPIPEELYCLRSLTRKRKQLNDIRTCTINQSHAHSHCMYETGQVTDVNITLIEQLDEHIKAIDKAIDEILDQQEEIKTKIELILKNLRGVGKLTMVSLLAETGCFELFESIGQLISYTGYDVIEDQSGKHIGKTKISKKGNSYIRYALYMPSLNVVRWTKGPFSNLYERVFERTRIKKKANVAVQRKLLIILYTLWKKEEAFDPKYQMTIGEEELKPSFGKKEKINNDSERKKRA